MYIQLKMTRIQTHNTIIVFLCEGGKGEGKEEEEGEGEREREEGRDTEEE